MPDLIPAISTINPCQLTKGQSISGEVVWNHYIVHRPEKLKEWSDRFGGEQMARLAMIGQVLQRVKDWVEVERRRQSLPPLVMHTVGGNLNVLEDAEASAYLNGQAFQGLNRHTRSTLRLMEAVDPNQLSEVDKREHESRVNEHSFIAAATQGAKLQIRRMKQAGQQPPKLDGAEDVIKP